MQHASPGQLCPPQAVILPCCDSACGVLAWPLRRPPGLAASSGRRAGALWNGTGPPLETSSHPQPPPLHARAPADVSLGSFPRLRSLRLANTALQMFQRVGAVNSLPQRWAGAQPVGVPPRLKNRPHTYFTLNYAPICHPPYFIICSLTRLAFAPLPWAEVAPNNYQKLLPPCVLQLPDLQFLDITGGGAPSCFRLHCMPAHVAIWHAVCPEGSCCLPVLIACHAWCTACCLLAHPAWQPHT